MAKSYYTGTYPSQRSGWGSGEYPEGTTPKSDPGEFSESAVATETIPFGRFVAIGATGAVEFTGAETALDGVAEESMKASDVDNRQYLIGDEVSVKKRGYISVPIDTTTPPVVGPVKIGNGGGNKGLVTGAVVTITTIDPSDAKVVHVSATKAIIYLAGSGQLKGTVVA